MNEKRPMWAPTNTFQRLLYVVIAILAPRTLIQLYYQEGADFSWVILWAWWLATFLYTIDWAVASYRKWRVGNLPAVRS